MLQSNVSNPLVAIASHLPLPGLLASYPHIIGHSFLSRLQLNGALSVLLKAAPNVTLNFIRNDDSSDLSGWTLEPDAVFSSLCSRSHIATEAIVLPALLKEQLPCVPDGGRTMASVAMCDLLHEEKKTASVPKSTQTGRRTHHSV